MGLLDSARRASYDPLSTEESLDAREDNNHRDDAGIDPTSRSETCMTIALLFPYVLMWLIQLVEGVLSATAGILAPYVSSAFALHALTPTVGIMSSVVGGITNLTLAKVLDAFGRPQGFMCRILLAVSGLAMTTACNSVQAYAASQVFQTVGNNGILYTLTVIVAESSSLRNRGLIQAVVSSPNIFTFFLAGPIVAVFLNGPGWRWAFGLFTVLVPGVTLPLLAIILNSHRKTQQLDLVSTNPDDDEDDHVDGPRHSCWQSLLYYTRQFDAVGLVLLSAGVALLLLPFNLYASQGWSSLAVTGTVVVGIVLLIGFFIWEKHYASITFLQYSLLLDRTALGACILSATLFISYWSWSSFFSSYLQVFHNLSVKNASYIVQLYTVCSVLGSIAVGALIHYTGRFRPVCLYVGIPVSVLGSACMLHYCKIQSSSSLLAIVVAQILISVAAGAIMVADEIAMLAAVTATASAPSQSVSHRQTAIATSLAVLGVFGNVGAAIGLTIASAIWQHIFPASLVKYLGRDNGGVGGGGVGVDLDAIYANISTQLSFPVGSATRTAIVKAYGDALVWMLGVGTGIWIVGFIAVLCWKDINVTSMRRDSGGIAT
ncbi:major facilitator superfamily domain-containing protein [Aspergillus granulosus]|uniref:Major facilitator superfamily domain-containing protein n=1 Tax=Aspergillus granulosus TaxID=176169 RepID=A0ABR4HRM6_9EURO